MLIENSTRSYLRLFALISFTQFCSFLLVLKTGFDVSETVQWEISRQVPTDDLPVCSPARSDLKRRNVTETVGKLVDFTASEEFALMSQLIDGGLSFGGKSSYTNCRSLHNIAIIVPYRNRRKQLNIFVRYMHSFLQKQLVKYTIFVIEQADDLPFNRGALINVGFAEANSYGQQFDCFIFHDVDMLPEDERNSYSCPEGGKPSQLAYAVDIHDFKPLQRRYAGGVTAITAKDFARVNGFSNDYWGWGSEDDDFSRRLSFANMTLTRSIDTDPSAVEYSKYRTLYHKKENENPLRGNVFLSKVMPDDILRDGVSNLKFKRKLTKLSLFHHHDVDMLPEDERNSYSCPEEGKPRQLAFSVDLYDDFKPVYRGYAGGVTAITSKDFARTNGFSNVYWGWGNEDNDFFRRLSHCNMTLVRSIDTNPSAIEYSRYRTLNHPKEKENPVRLHVFLSKVMPDDIVTDGLDSLKFKRKVTRMTLYYIHTLVELEPKK